MTCTGNVAVRRGIMSKKMPEGWKMLSISSNACLGRKVGSLLHSDVIDFLLTCILGSSAVCTLQVLQFPLKFSRWEFVWLDSKAGIQPKVPGIICDASKWAKTLQKWRNNWGLLACNSCMTSEILSERGTVPLPANRPAFISKFDVFLVGHFGSVLVQLLSSSQMQPLWYDDNIIINICIFICHCLAVCIQLTTSTTMIINLRRKSCFSLHSVWLCLK